MYSKKRKMKEEMQETRRKKGNFKKMTNDEKCVYKIKV